MGPEAVERRLTAILSADVAGYSRLIAEDEEGAVRRLSKYRDEVAILVPSHRGRVVDFTGDNFLAEFPTALEAVEAALEIQRVIRALNADFPAERRMEFRIGVHLGDIRVEGERIYGDGVNIAARLGGLAEPGGICISATVHEQIERKLDLRFEDLGEQQVKNIPRPVRVYRLVVEPEVASRPTVKRRRSALLALGTVLVVGIVGLMLWQLWPDPGRRPASPESDTETTALDERFTVPGFSDAPAIAVLPFNNLSGDPEQEYFADGLAEELITRLSRRRHFPVIARNSSFTYKDKAVDVKQVGRELGARYVVEGSVRRAGDRIRISAQLIDATTGHHLWAETYDRELRDIFSVQDEITDRIVAAVAPEWYSAEQERAVRKEPRDLDAYDLLARGFWHLSKETPHDNEEARSLFEQASERNPQLAMAFTGIAYTHSNDVSYGWSGSIPRSLEELEQAARRSVELDPRDPWSHLVMAVAYGLTGRIDEAIAASERAVRLNPSLAEGYVTLGTLLALSGRPEEAIESLEQAMRLSPLDRDKTSRHLGMGWAHFAAGRYDEAAESARRTLREAPSHNRARQLLAASYAQLGRLDEAHAALADSLRVEPGFSIRKLEAQSSSMDPDLRDRYLEGLRKAGLPEE